MPGFREKVVERWNDWQLIVLVLLSLLVQLLFLGTAGLRKRTQPRKWSKRYFWVLHLGSKYVAAYPLGILSRATTNDPNADIQAFWAALLLFHLGRPDDFTALALEDNSIWSRQLTDLGVHAGITVYVFSRYCVDKDFERFIAPFVLISLAGLLKCGEQVYALKQATMESLIKSVLRTPDAGPDYADTMDRVDGMLRSGVLPSINGKRLRRLNSDAQEACETRANQNIEPQVAVDITTETDQNMQQNGTTAADAGGADETKTVEYNSSIAYSAYSLFSRFKVLFADGLFSFEDRRESRELFKGKDAKWAFKVIEIELGFVYDLLYTKASVSRTGTGKFIRVATLLFTLAGSLYTIFTNIHTTQYKQRHKCVTYTLLAGASFSEALILARYIYSIRSVVGSQDERGRGCLNSWSVHLVQNRSRWSGCMAQSNLITFCLQNLPSDSFMIKFSRQRPYIEKIIAPVVLIVRSALSIPAPPEQAMDALRAAASQYLQRPSVLEQLRSKRFWEKFDKTVYKPVRPELEAFIFQQVKEKEGYCIQGEKVSQETGIPDRRTSFIDCRGDWVLKDERVYDNLGWSFQGKEFDESLLLWHIATDLCHRKDKEKKSTGQQASSGNGTSDQQTKEHMEYGKEISDYLLYLMVVHPLMLSSSTTMAIKRCRDTCAEARRYFLKEHIQTKLSKRSVGSSIDEDNAHNSLLDVKTPLRASVVKGDKSKSVLWDGCFLAKQLNQIADKGKKWQIISRVCVEMLCYTAVQCGGYQHAERLKEGGELITFVCLLMTHLGMGKHYRTEVGDAYAHLTPFTAQLASRGPIQAQGIQQDAAISSDEASTSGHGQQV